MAPVLALSHWSYHRHCRKEWWQSSFKNNFDKTFISRRTWTSRVYESTCYERKWVHGHLVLISITKQSLWIKYDHILKNELPVKKWISKISTHFSFLHFMIFPYNVLFIYYFCFVLHWLILKKNLFIKNIIMIVFILVHTVHRHTLIPDNAYYIFGKYLYSQ